MWREPWFWIVVLVVIILLFGATRLPNVAKSVGQSMRVFRREVKGLQDDVKSDKAEAETPAKSETPSDTKS